MMAEEQKSNYIFLDGEEERQGLINQIHEVREAVVAIANQVPEAEWYTPRYHGWSLGAMLAHLNVMDNLSMMSIKLGLLGVRAPVSRGMLDGFNGFIAQLFQNRVVTTTLKSIPKNEARIANLITTLPLNRMTREVYEPNLQRYLTVEQALQSLFLHHWQEHLKTMRVAEGLETPESTESEESE